MYELQSINQNITSDFSLYITKVIKKEKLHILGLAVEYAVRKELPNVPSYFINPIVRKVKKQLDIVSKRKVIPFKSENEAQLFFEKEYGEYLDLANKNKLDKEETNIIYQAYDLSKYDKKVIYNKDEYLLNTNHIYYSFRKHGKAYNRWMKEKKALPPEENFNISHNSQTSVNLQLGFLRQQYKSYNHNPYAYNLEKEVEQNLIAEYEKDNYMMARAISSMVSTKFTIDKFKDNDYKTAVKSFKNIRPFLNSDRPIDKKDIVDSWLTSVALLYLKINPQGIKKTTLAKYITTLAKCTDLYKDFKGKYVFSPEKIREIPIREFAIYNNLRLLEFTDKRRKLTFEENTTKETEKYMKNIIQYIKKYKL
ncbi:hypothetical protein [Arcobacter sp. YIC-310]|uniref:hypothetical protein n=1 Tax=Arcobacter sp. YIC-310 TaxID=3376632 RepID=UPI003C1C3EE4